LHQHRGQDPHHEAWSVPYVECMCIYIYIYIYIHNMNIFIL
jgi:hypothetical protein